MQPGMLQVRQSVSAAPLICEAAGPDFTLCCLVQMPHQWQGQAASAPPQMQWHGQPASMAPQPGVVQYALVPLASGMQPGAGMLMAAPAQHPMQLTPGASMHHR